MKFSLCLVASLVVLIGVQSQVRADLYMEVEGIPGEATQAGYEGWIDVASFSVTVSNASSSTIGGGGAGKATHSPFRITKEVDKASPKLMEALFVGSTISYLEMDIVLPYEGREALPVATWRLQDVRVTRLSTSGAADALPTEEVEFDFNELLYTYREYDKTGKEMGKVEASWNFGLNTTSFTTEGDVDNFQFYSTIPEPASLAMLLTGAAGVLLRRGRATRAA